MAWRGYHIGVWRAEDDIDLRVLYGPTEQGGPRELPLDAYALLEEMARAGCSELQRRAMAAWIQVRSIATVARMLAMRPRDVRRMLKAALGQLEGFRRRRTRQVLSRQQIEAVFNEESSRYGYHDERHCPPGQEECAKTGYCTRRWYLFYG